MWPTAARTPTAIDRDGLDGRVACGYQGWFTAAADGAGLGWSHWLMGDRAAQGGWRPAIDMLPDISELGEHERCAIQFGDPAHGAVEVFSSHLPLTVNRHFRWIRDYGIDCVFVQRFGGALRIPTRLAHATKVLGACRDGALEHGRVYAVMYDLSGMQAGSLHEVLEDWRQLRSRTLDRDPALHEVMAECDVIRPWTVGRYKTPEGVKGHAKRHWHPDVEWCRERGIAYLPAGFPGFSWHNLKGGPLAQIPRLGGRFLWSQAVAAHEAGATSLYVAMFDEVDEATAIFKCVDPPPGKLASRFVGMEGLPSDHYLRLNGETGRLLRGEHSASFDSPANAHSPVAR